MTHTETISYPRKTFIRRLIHWLTIPSFHILSRMNITGTENIPAHGPLLVVANHFSFIDPVAVIRIAPWPIEFLGGAQFPHAPTIVKSLPGIYGYYPLFRGTGSRRALRAGEAILKKYGVLGIFPEGGNWAEVLRPARPGAAYLASRTQTRILPIGLYGLNDIFPVNIRQRPEVHVNIGPPIGPFSTTGRGRDRRRQLDDIGREIMQSIANLLPDEKRGFLAEDPAVRKAARGTEIYPWEHKAEGEVVGTPR